MSDQAPRHYNGNDLLNGFHRALMDILQNGRTVPDGNGGTVNVTADAKYFEVMASHLKNNEITLDAGNTILAQLGNIQKKAGELPASKPVDDDDMAGPIIAHIKNAMGH
jgi:hypothetical protein